MSKGDKRIKESQPGNFARGYDAIFGKCPRCHENVNRCACMPTEDGPGQDGEDKEEGK